jgi:DNA-binding CsgD family transcriptional regulator
MLGGFLAYHIISLVIGGVAISAMFILYLKSKSPKLPPLLLANLLLLLFVAALSYELYCGLIGLKTPFRGVVHEGEQFICLGLCVLLPRISRPPILSGFPKHVERGFAIASGLIAIAFGAFFLFPFPLTVYTGMYALIYADLSLALLYFSLSSMIFRRRTPPSTAIHHYNHALTILRGLTIALLPALFVVDFIGWMIPALAAIIPEDLSILPAFYVVMSLIMLVGSINEILEPVPPPEMPLLDETLLRRFNLSRREAEIMLLALQFLSYKEIGEELFISVGTVRTHLIHIYQKTGARNRLELSRIVHHGTASR